MSEKKTLKREREIAIFKHGYRRAIVDVAHLLTGIAQDDKLLEDLRDKCFLKEKEAEDDAERL